MSQHDDLRELAAAGLIENYYTAVETVLYRIAQVFGNNLDPQRWHSDLLRRMCVSIPDVRPRVLSEITYSRLDELMRFRHFKRYSFHLEFDWQRLELLLVVARGLAPLPVFKSEKQHGGVEGRAGTRNEEFPQ